MVLTKATASSKQRCIEISMLGISSFVYTNLNMHAACDQGERLRTCVTLLPIIYSTTIVVHIVHVHASTMYHACCMRGMYCARTIAPNYDDITFIDFTRREVKVQKVQTLLGSEF